MNYLRYRPEIEQPADGEDAAIEGIIAAMSRQVNRVAEREGRAVRASHANSTGLVTGELVVADDLPPELALRLFVGPGRYSDSIGTWISRHGGFG